MKTLVDASFRLDGLGRRDDFALHNNPDVCKQSKELYSELNGLANADLDPIVWSGNFPTFPEDRLRYEQVMQRVVAPASLKVITESITPVLNRLNNQLIETTKLITNTDSKLVDKLLLETDWTYEFQPKVAHLCIPSEPPPGGHICEVSVYYSVGAWTPLKFKWPIQTKSEVFTYTMDCFIRFLLGE